MSEGYDWRETAADFDRRIDRLTERHEALAQSVEMLSHSNREIQDMQRKTQEMQQKNEELQRKNEAMLGQLGDFIHSLARIAESHERRIEGLETQ